MSTSSRFPGGAGKDNTARKLTYENQSPAYAASLAIATTKSRTSVMVAITGALSLTIGVGANDNNPPFVGDEVDFQFSADAGGARTVTFSTGFATSAATLVVAASKYGNARFRFNGSVWVEQSRTVTA